MISQIREIPDYQEVYADADTDQSLIFEMLEESEHIDASQMAMFHIEQSIRDNDATIVRDDGCMPSPQVSPPVIVNPVPWNGPAESKYEFRLVAIIS